MDKLINFGGSGIEESLFKFILSICPLGSKVLEFGGGDVSTVALGNKYDLYTVEQDRKWMKHYNLTNYIYADIIDGWYNIDILKKSFPNNIDLCLIDGPLGEGNRNGILKNLDLLNNVKKIIVHDTYRDSEYNLSKSIADILKMDIKLYSSGDHWAYIYKKDL